MANKYPPDVMQRYHEMWRWYGWCGTSLLLTIVSVVIAAPFHAERSVPFMIVEVTLFIVAAVSYVRGYRSGKAFGQQARGWRAAQELTGGQRS